MKTTILKASPALAADISKDLLNRKSQSGKTVFKRYELTDGFEIKWMTKSGEEVVFRYTHEKGRHQFNYNEDLLTFF